MVMVRMFHLRRYLFLFTNTFLTKGNNIVLLLKYLDTFCTLTPTFQSFFMESVLLGSTLSMQIIIFFLLFLSPHGNLRPVVHSQNEESKVSTVSSDSSDSIDSSDSTDSTDSSDSSDSTAKPEDEADGTDGPVKAEIGPGFIHDKSEEDSTSTEEKEESEKKPATVCPLIKLVFTLGLACS